MNSQELEITIGKDGKVMVHIKGIKGRQCLEITAWLEKAVGRAEDVTRTAEYYEPDGVVRIDLGQGEARA